MNAYLLLANGMVFAGQSVGAEGVTVGEVVFATGMVGFEETLTDPSYYGQIITQTYPLIGNYGMNKDDMESDRIWAKGYICLLYTSVRAACKKPLMVKLSPQAENIPEMCKAVEAAGADAISQMCIRDRFRPI